MLNKQNVFWYIYLKLLVSLLSYVKLKTNYFICKTYEIVCFCCGCYDIQLMRTLGKTLLLDQFQ